MPLAHLLLHSLHSLHAPFEAMIKHKDFLPLFSPSPLSLSGPLHAHKLLFSTTCKVISSQLANTHVFSPHSRVQDPGSQNVGPGTHRAQQPKPLSPPGGWPLRDAGPLRALPAYPHPQRILNSVASELSVPRSPTSPPGSKIFLTKVGSDREDSTSLQA